MSALVNIYSTLLKPPAPDFPHVLHGHRDLSDPELPDHLQGFIGFILKNAHGEMTQTRYHLLQHIERVRNHFSMEVEEEDVDAYEAWVRAVNGICFWPDGSVHDPSGATLFALGGAEPDPEATVPYPEDARQRKTRSGAILREMGVPVLESLPPVLGEGEVELRDAPDIARRALSLFAVAIRAESLAGGAPIPVADLRERSPRSFDALSPHEAAFLAQEAPAERDIIAFSWRYEALYLLLWALGIFPDLPTPITICDVPLVARTIIQGDSDALIANAQLRPSQEILSALDLHYRMHWAARNARLAEHEAPAGLDEGVLQERRHALNWLVRNPNVEWDNVDTPT